MLVVLRMEWAEFRKSCGVIGSKRDWNFLIWNHSMKTKWSKVCLKPFDSATIFSRPARPNSVNKHFIT